MSEQKNIRYLNSSPMDELWGIAVTTAGHQRIAAHSIYPAQQQHPTAYSFHPEQGRILTEYQLVYISEGSGWFESESCPKQALKAGTMLLLFPGERHSYSPGNKGWYEYWVGFKGHLMESWMENGFFTKKKAVYEIGLNTTIIGLFEEIVELVIEERNGYRQLISSIVYYLLGEIYYKEKNNIPGQTKTVDKINEARAIMKNNPDHPLPGEEIARKLNVSYSWFRSMFKNYTGVSPAQYQQHLRYLRAKELLSTTTLSISEIAIQLNFEGLSQFSSFFQKKEGISPSQYRKLRKERQGSGGG